MIYYYHNGLKKRNCVASHRITAAMLMLMHTHTHKCSVDMRAHQQYQRNTKMAYCFWSKYFLLQLLTALMHTKQSLSLGELFHFWYAYNIVVFFCCCSLLFIPQVSCIVLILTWLLLLQFNVINHRCVHINLLELWHWLKL